MAGTVDANRVLPTKLGHPLRDAPEVRDDSRVGLVVRDIDVDREVDDCAGGDAEPVRSIVGTLGVLGTLRCGEPRRLVPTFLEDGEQAQLRVENRLQLAGLAGAGARASVRSGIGGDLIPGRYRDRDALRLASAAVRARLRKRPAMTYTPRDLFLSGTAGCARSARSRSTAKRRRSTIARRRSTTSFA